MGFTLASRMRRTIVALIATLVVAVWAYETRMLDSGYGAWLDMLGDEDERPAPGSHLAFDATAYCKGQTTAAGVNVRRGIAAADPQLLPVGSVVTLATGDPEYNGVYTIMDTGPAVQGRHLDLYIWSCGEALKFGRRRIEVNVLRLGWDPRASSPSLIDRLFRRREVARRAAASREDKSEPAAAEPAASQDPHAGDGFETVPPGPAAPIEPAPEPEN
ncbi:MAG TPA: 3D domain-containing protein [Vicinamibacterales bacterium]|jgi:3D (Asp-Asp-Asp) domain-containing protein|nr:3D domain-containing protein [Vicinamibacterales bacterium]